MAITIDLENNPFYQEGKQEGRQKGRQEGRQEEKQEIAKQLLLSGEFTVQKISNITGLSSSAVESLLKEISK